MLFKTNTTGHTHPSISLYITEQDRKGETKENNNWHSTQETRTPQKQSYRLCWGAPVQLHQYWTTLLMHVFVRPITRTRIKNAHTHICTYIHIHIHIYIYIYIYKHILTQSFWTGTEVIRRKHITNRPTDSFQRLFLDLLLIGWRGCAIAMSLIKLPPSCSSLKRMSQSNHKV